MPPTRNLTVVALVVGLASWGSPALGVAPTTEWVSVTDEGVAAKPVSLDPALSFDGRYVAFESEASDLVEGDTNGKYDIFVRDLDADMTTRTSVRSNGTEANGVSKDASISADGRFVVFESKASNLVANDNNDVPDIFVHDRDSLETTRVTLRSNDSSADASISADGRFVVFQSKASNLVTNDNNATSDIFVHDRDSLKTRRVTLRSNGTSRAPSISSNGLLIAFESGATNLVAGDTNSASDIFVRNWQVGWTKRVSVASNGSQGNKDSHAPSISADGTVIAFESKANNLFKDDENLASDVLVHTRSTAITQRVSIGASGWSVPAHSLSISAHGRDVLFEWLPFGSPPGTIAVRDREAGETTNLSWDYQYPSPGAEDGSISADGRTVGFVTRKALDAGDTNETWDVYTIGPLR